jgi:hypothetical protein
MSTAAMAPKHMLPRLESELVMLPLQQFIRFSLALSWGHQTCHGSAPVNCHDQRVLGVR